MAQVLTFEILLRISRSSDLWRNTDLYNMSKYESLLPIINMYDDIKVITIYIAQCAPMYRHAVQFVNGKFNNG